MYVSVSEFDRHRTQTERMSSYPQAQVIFWCETEARGSTNKMLRGCTFVFLIFVLYCVILTLSNPLYLKSTHFARVLLFRNARDFKIMKSSDLCALD